MKLMRTRRVSILNVKGTKWKGNKAEGLAESYKLHYSGEGKNSVGIVLSSDIVKGVIKVTREGDRINLMKVNFGTSTLNIVSAYAMQAGATEEENEILWRKLENVIVIEMVD